MGLLVDTQLVLVIVRLTTVSWQLRVVPMLVTSPRVNPRLSTTTDGVSLTGFLLMIRPLVQLRLPKSIATVRQIVSVFSSRFQNQKAQSPCGFNTNSRRSSAQRPQLKHT